MSNSIPIISREDFLDRSLVSLSGRVNKYYAMYSSLWGGIVRDPELMLLPIDDHLAHRGDGVFETLICVRSGIYNLAAHLERLSCSAKAIEIAVPNETADVIVDTCRAGGHEDALIRIIVSRGPGGMGVNPYESEKPQLYILVYELPSNVMEYKSEGASIVWSRYPCKAPAWAGVKTCNYLPNVMMKKEAVDRGVDFSISLDPQGFVAEGATENMCIINKSGEFLCPPAEYLLNGTTMARAFELIASMVETPVVKTFSKEEVYSAREGLIFSTTNIVSAVTKVENVLLGDGRPGPVFRALRKLLVQDMLENEVMRTLVRPV